MKKSWLSIAVVALGIVLLAGVASAMMAGKMMGRGGSTLGIPMGMMVTGSYEDLVALRESSQTPIMPWIDSEEEFKQMQEHHTSMMSGGSCPMLAQSN